MTTCDVCMTSVDEVMEKDGLTRCPDIAVCKANIEALLSPVRDMDHPRLVGLPNIARDAIARAGDPMLNVGGGSFRLSDLCRMLLGWNQPIVDAAIAWREAGDRRNEVGPRATGQQIDAWMNAVDALSEAVREYQSCE